MIEHGNERRSSLRRLLRRAAAAARHANDLERAFDAGAALSELRDRLDGGHGAFARALDRAGLPKRTGYLYVSIAHNRARIEAAGCESVREARELLETARRRPPGRRPGASRLLRVGSLSEARRSAYAEGYRDGCRSGEAIARTHQATTARLPGMSAADVKWLATLAHPDRHDDRHAARANRATAALLEHCDLVEA